MTGKVEDTIAALWRIESGRINGSVARIVRDVGLAEELAQDALVAALERWPQDGIPDRAGAWLLTTARNAAFDLLRRDRSLRQKLEQIGLDLEAQEALTVPDFVDELDARRNDVLKDDLLRLMFTACHPVLSLDARLALTLKLLGGLATGEIARAFLVPESTMAQRIVRAKRTLGEAKVPFELPPPAELGERLGAVLEAVYLIFNEGYTGTAGADWMRPALVDEALRLGRILAELAPNEPEVHGLVALMELQASRMAARLDAAKRPVLLLDQDRARWDGVLVRRGLAALERAARIAMPRGSYVLQAEIAACHARAHRAELTDWRRIADLYGELAAVQPSPVVELNRAVAVGMADGPAAGLALVDRLRADGRLDGYHWLPSVRGDLLFKLGRRPEARAEFERAAALTANAAERELLLARMRDAADA
ncbi:RNA polymerase sigma factor [Massilia sp. CFBP9026]|uniref:RNA polymerase sigma factor n=1 Tax=Massilia sp. CFBP9026 TaxID=3096536 RepID=UPI002A6B0030|nr:RNA polymerase sigma factor [Massilia sp. CFBP9026]MDY0963623.1 RNA polymerase sigma factor [Massilia sp. CFBP9026]